jgi:Resolvase, N terminal domain
MIIGYARVSTMEQNFDLQRDGLNPAGCEKIIEDTVSGGKVPAAPAGDDPQQAFAAFQGADSPDVMRQAVGQFPILARPYRIAAIERAVAEQVPSTNRCYAIQPIALKREFSDDKRVHRRFLQYFGYPEDLPDLRAHRPPDGNRHKGSERLCYRAIRDGGCLSDTY